MHRYEWSRDIDSGTAATRKAPLVNERYRRRPKHTISREKEGHILCDFRFSSSFQKIDMILLTRPEAEGGLIGPFQSVREARAISANMLHGIQPWIEQF